ncbi:hypothetical protein CHS0354_009770 [Potamilus streckersoni]|uniref:Uncharacterized protein n=1 Tax=Potamilus streckersoni TaxID=2493646 RepID=A0AAE0W2Z9_9BIVA|nr:hypothetical protein CHS0354_009770 [Potamilus streckersoni]
METGVLYDAYSRRSIEIICGDVNADPPKEVVQKGTRHGYSLAWSRGKPDPHPSRCQDLMHPIAIDQGHDMATTWHGLEESLILTYLDVRTSCTP